MEAFDPGSLILILEQEAKVETIAIPTNALIAGKINAASSRPIEPGFMLVTPAHASVTRPSKSPQAFSPLFGASEYSEPSFAAD
jgi:hypothetical protein